MCFRAPWGCLGLPVRSRLAGTVSQVGRLLFFMLFKKRPEIVEAFRFVGFVSCIVPAVGAVKDVNPKDRCNTCGAEMDVHGFAESVISGSLVCPGDWVIVKRYDEGVLRITMNDQLFNSMFEPAGDAPAPPEQPQVIAEILEQPQSQILAQAKQAKPTLPRDGRIWIAEARQWSCPQCAERCNPLLPDWKWNGTDWEHTHDDKLVTAVRAPQARPS